MTKAELLKALESLDENEEITFLYTDCDHDGWTVERVANVTRVESTKAYADRAHAENVKQWTARIEEAEKQIEKLTAEMENAPTKAAAKRNTERARAIEWNKEIIAIRRGWLAKN